MTDSVLFVPGAFTDRRLFAHQLDHLGELATPRFAELADVDTVDAMAEAILADAPERFALAGLSLEHFPVRLRISGVGDVVCAFVRHELIEQSADDVPERFDRSCLGFAA